MNWWFSPPIRRQLEEGDAAGGGSAVDLARTRIRDPRNCRLLIIVAFTGVSSGDGVGQRKPLSMRCVMV